MLSGILALDLLSCGKKADYEIQKINRLLIGLIRRNKKENKMFTSLCCYVDLKFFIPYDPYAV